MCNQKQCQKLASFNRCRMSFSIFLETFFVVNIFNLIFFCEVKFWNLMKIFTYKFFDKASGEVVYFKASYNEKYLRLNFDPKNETHLGKISAEIIQDLSFLTAQFKVDVSKQKYIDLTVDFCQWLQNRRINYLINVFKNYFDKFVDPKLLKCPIKKGFYIAATARKIQKNLETFVPSFIPLKGNLTLTVIMKAKVDKKLQHLCSVIEVYHFD